MLFSNQLFEEKICFGVQTTYKKAVAHFIALAERTQLPPLMSSKGRIREGLNLMVYQLKSQL